MIRVDSPLLGQRISFGRNSPVPIESSLSRMSSIRRRLFDSNIEDHDIYLESELRKNRIESKTKWNFDFEKGTALEGRYQWLKEDKARVPIMYQPDTAVPVTESEDNTSRKIESHDSDLDSSADGSPAAPEASKAPSPVGNELTLSSPKNLAAVLEKTPPAAAMNDSSSPLSRKRKQPVKSVITDYMKAKKKRPEEKDCNC